MPGIHHAAICTTDVEHSMKFWRDGLGFAELFDHSFTGDWPELFGAKTNRPRSIFLGDPQTPDAGIVELVVFEGAADDAPAPQREVDETLSALAAIGFTDGVRRISMPAVLVDLIGPAQ